MPTRRPLLLLGCLLGCTSRSPAQNTAADLEPQPLASHSVRPSVRAPLAKPTALELVVTDKAGRTLAVSLGTGAFADCLVVAEPGERGFALFSVRLDDSDPSSSKLADSDGLSGTTVGCIAAVVAGHREAMVTARDTLWYFSLQP